MDMGTGSAVQTQEGREVARHEPTRGALQYRPVVDVEETAEELRLVVDLPGSKAEEIDINFEQGVLTIHAKVEQRQPEGTSYLLREYGIGEFHRVFEVSEAVDAERISAEYSDGVLVLHLPKAEKARVRKIEVRAG